MLMVQTNAQPMKTSKLKGPPPVPPRPNQSVVAEALAKTRKAVAESKAKSRVSSKYEHVTTRSKTLDRTTATPTPSPKQNGLARVKSFIRDVISDRSSSSDERKSSGQNSRRSSSDSSSIPTPASNKKSNESLNSKAVKTCKQILVRSLSTSNKLDQDSKCKVTKSSSFAEKTLPLRKAPPPPLSPKPKLKPMKPLPVQNSSLERSKQKPKLPPPDVSQYSSPVDAKPPQSPVLEAPYATVEEVQEFDDRLRNSPSKQVINPAATQNVPASPKCDVTVNKNNNSLERKTSRVTEMLISEILASRNNNKDEPNTVIDKGKECWSVSNGGESPEMELMKDMNNHEMLIYELQTMRSQSNVPENLDNKEPEMNGQCDSEDSEQNYAMSSVTSSNTDDGSDQAYAYILDDDLKSRLRKQFRAISTMSLQGLPPLPKSLSGFTDGEPLQEPTSPIEEKPPTDLDSQLIYLKKEMMDNEYEKSTMHAASRRASRSRNRDGDQHSSRGSRSRSIILPTSRRQLDTRYPRNSGYSCDVSDEHEQRFRQRSLRTPSPSDGEHEQSLRDRLIRDQNHLNRCTPRYERSRMCGAGNLDDELERRHDAGATHVRPNGELDRRSVNKHYRVRSRSRRDEQCNQELVLRRTNRDSDSTVGGPYQMDAPSTDQPQAFVTSEMPRTNLVPEFDPVSKTQSITDWIAKVEECSEIYEWDERETIHYALPKLVGLARSWYQSLPSVKFSWPEWKRKLTESFPSIENYTELLTEMLSLRVKFGEPLDPYYYNKLNLLNRCQITGRRAVDCILGGIEDRAIKLCAQAAGFQTPEQILKYFKSVKVGQARDGQI